MRFEDASRLAADRKAGFKRKGWADLLTLQGPAIGAPRYEPAWLFPDRTDPKFTPEDIRADDWLVAGFEPVTGDDGDPALITTYWYVIFQREKGVTAAWVCTQTSDGQLYLQALTKELEKQYGPGVVTGFTPINRAQYEESLNKST